ncbi:uncharacterized protein LOC123694300 isoform X4 [Colias croceus]|uniref:uncharacterized protein LOC123694300 isoform X4 n=1 Tax=Colias crocea TaxID=72248 RepID=UPI001E281329|nr:uncharacterized protein LOC123694300 isoform X4 [Colias croceus]
MDKELNCIHRIKSNEHNTLSKLIKDLFEVFPDFQDNTLESISSTLVDLTFLEEIKKLTENVNIAFGKTLRDIKLDLPSSIFKEQIYNTIEDVITAFLKHTNDKTWLHVEVTPDGSATNVHLLGQSEMWQDKLQKGLLTWDQDKNIVENIFAIFDINNQSGSPNSLPADPGKQGLEDATGPICGICFCTQLPDYPGLPQPLCQNMNCDVYFHKNCLFQWLVACEGGRPPAFGVINGSCPTCLQPISCSEKDC